MPEAASIDNSSLFAVQNGADTKKVSYQTLVDQLKKDGIGGGRGRFSQDFTIVLKRQTDPITTPCSVELFTKDAYMLYVKIRLPGELNFTKLGDG